MVAGEIRLGRNDHRLGLLDQCLLQALLLFDDRDRRLRAHDIGLRLIELCAVVVVDHLDQHVTGFDLLEVLRNNLARKAPRVRIFEIGRVFSRDAVITSTLTSVAGVAQPLRIHNDAPIRTLAANP